MDYNILGGLNSSCKNKFLWIIESSELVLPQLELIKNNIEKFSKIYKKIFVHDKRYLNISDNIEYVPCGSNMPWIKNAGIHKKTKWMSLISSGKAISKGHEYRNYLTDQFKNKNLPIDFYGRNTNPFNIKEDVLNDYYYSITMENGKYDVYFTEKIMDCFASGTIPIYYGTDEITNYFNKEGIVFLKENMDLSFLNEEYYFSKMDAIKDNYDRCINHKMADDFLYEKIIQNI
jgi:hypothetical protein